MDLNLVLSDSQPMFLTTPLFNGAQRRQTVGVSVENGIWEHVPIRKKNIPEK